MATETASQPPAAKPDQDGDDLGGNWFTNNWKGLLAAVAGFLMLAMSGGEMLLMILGALILAAGAVALMKPELYDRAGDALGGMWNRGIEKVREKALEWKAPGLDLTAQELATPEGQKAKLSDEEKKFELWALSDEVLSKLDEQDKSNLKKILEKMRSGKDGEQVKLTQDEVNQFVSGLTNTAEQQALHAQAKAQLEVFSR